MRITNRAKLLWSYLRRSERVPGLPVEYIVETTAKCNLYCPMCPRETYPQPKADMADEIFERLVQGAARTGEHMMLIGLGEPLMDPKIFDRVEFCQRHGVATLLSTNGTLLDEKAAARLLATPLEHVTLSFDGASKETFEHYRKGARFERVRDNFVRFARMKQQRRSKMQVVVQMVRMPGNAHEVDEFRRFWSAVEGVDQVRIKEDETNLVQPEARRLGAALSLLVARPNVRQAGWQRVSVLPELHAGRRAHRPCAGNAARRNLQLACHARTAPHARRRPGHGHRHVRALLHGGPAPSVSGGKLARTRQVGAPRHARGGALDLPAQTSAGVAAPGARGTGSALIGRRPARQAWRGRLKASLLQ